MSQSTHYFPSRSLFSFLQLSSCFLAHAISLVHALQNIVAKQSLLNGQLSLLYVPQIQIETLFPAQGSIFSSDPISTTNVTSCAEHHHFPQQCSYPIPGVLCPSHQLCSFPHLKLARIQLPLSRAFLARSKRPSPRAAAGRTLQGGTSYQNFLDQSAITKACGETL